MRNWAAFLATLIFTFSSTVTAEGKIYHWVDTNGENHFSDTASPNVNTEEINVRNQNLLIKEDQQKDRRIREGSGLQREIAPQKPSTAISYQADITSPLDDTAIRSNNGTLDILVSITPEKQSNQKLQLILDGERLGKPQLSTTIRALNLDRGTHQVQAQLLDESGNLLAKTQIVTIYLQRATINTGK